MTHEPQLTTVREAHRFDERALAGYLTEHLDGFDGELRVLQFEGGQSNPTFLLSAGGRKYVLRKKPPGRLLPSAHQVDREHRVMKALHHTDVPVPEMLLLCQDDAVIGTPFFVMSYVPGRVMSPQSLAEVSPGETRELYADLNRVLAALHTVDYRAVGLSDYGRPGNYFGRQIARWSKQYQASQTDDIESMDQLMEHLPRRIPPDDTTTIVHGDFRLENMIVHPTEPRIAAVLDWELSTLGHPLADLAYNCMVYHFMAGNGTSLADLAGPKSGVPTEAEYVAEYCRRTGREGIPDWNFYLAFSFFRLASILQGVYQRGIQGNAASSLAIERGRMARRASDIAWSLLQEDA